MTLKFDNHDDATSAIEKANKALLSHGLSFTYVSGGDGFVLYQLTAPNVNSAVVALKQLNDEQRMEVFGNFCRHCGCDNPNCHCWNDE